MKGELRAGGLALIIRANNPENVYRTVTLMHSCSDIWVATPDDPQGPIYNPEQLLAWVFHCEALVNRRVQDNEVYLTNYGAMPASWLIPLDDPNAMNLEKLKEELHVSG